MGVDLADPTPGPRRYFVTLDEERVSKADLEAVLRDHIRDYLARAPLLFPEIGVAALGVEPGEVAALRQDGRVLRVVPVLDFENAIPGGPAAPPGPPGNGPLLLRAQVQATTLFPDHIVRVRAHEVWCCTTGKGVKVAVLDSGVWGGHPQLELAGGASFVPGSPDPAEDANGHGTRVAGILGARRSTESIVVGVAPDCELYSVKVINDADNSKADWIVAGIMWAAREGMDVVNMSVRPSRRDAEDESCLLELDRATGFVHEKGGFVANAAGNTGHATDEERRSLWWPATCKWVVAVGAHDLNNQRRADSSYGPLDQDRGVELMAPGWGVQTTARPVNVEDPLYGQQNQTSAACPHVAGAAALLKEANPSFGPDEIRQRLRASAIDMPPSGHDIETGFGRLDVRAAVFPNKWSVLLCVIRKLRFYVLRFVRLVWRFNAPAD